MVTPCGVKDLLAALRSEVTAALDEAGFDGSASDRPKVTVFGYEPYGRDLIGPYAVTLQLVGMSSSQRRVRVRAYGSTKATAAAELQSTLIDIVELLDARLDVWLAPGEGWDVAFHQDFDAVVWAADLVDLETFCCG